MNVPELHTINVVLNVETSSLVLYERAKLDLSLQGKYINWGHFGTDVLRSEFRCKRQEL
jgi:hypothetical protein